MASVSVLTTCKTGAPQLQPELRTEDNQQVFTLDVADSGFITTITTNDNLTANYQFQHIRLDQMDMFPVVETHGVADHAVASTRVLPSQIVFILVGLVGSGKSTFAQALQEHFPHFRRCSQDDLGDRRAVEALARSCLREGYSVVIDRTNFDASQRATWVRIAREIPGTLVWVLVFDTPYEVCAERLQSRISHPTITSPEQGIEVLQRFMSLYRPPEAYEGFDQMLALPVIDQPSGGYVKHDLENILTRLQQSPRIPSSAWRPLAWPGSHTPRGYASRGHGTRNSPQHSWRSGGYDDRN